MSLQKGNLTILLAIILIVCLGVGAYFVANLAGIKMEIPKVQPTEQKTSNSHTSTPEPVSDNSIQFDVEKAKVGDKIGSMTITKISGYKTDQATADSAFVDFKGAVTVTGEVNYNKPGGYGGESVCVTGLDHNSESKMPKLRSQFYVYISFCFNDIELAKKLLVKNPDEQSQGRRSVKIDNYKIQWFPVSITNMADLVSVSE